MAHALPSFLLVHPIDRFSVPIIATISEQILIETGRDRGLFDKAPISTRFYECLFIGYTVDNQKIWHLMRQLREADTE